MSGEADAFEGHLVERLFEGRLRPPEEAPRDQAESAFTPVLRGLLTQVPGLRAAAFVDGEGECVDYCSTLPPDEARILGAQLEVTVRAVERSLAALRAGRLVSMRLACERGDLAAARVDEEYLLVALGRPGTIDERTARLLGRVARGLRSVAGLQPPAWEEGAEGLRVVWDEAGGVPSALRLAGRLERVEAVLGRWRQPLLPLGVVLEGYLVRTDRGRELSLLRDPRGDRWYLART